MQYKKPKAVKNPDIVERLTANDVNMSVGSISRRPMGETKTSGIKIRGTGAATKGTMARGPMA